MNLVKKLLLTAGTITCLSFPVYAEKSKINENFHFSFGLELFSNFENNFLKENLDKREFTDGFSVSASIGVPYKQIGLFIGLESSMNALRSEQEEDKTGKMYCEMKMRQTNPFVKLFISDDKKENFLYLKGKSIGGEAELTAKYVKKAISFRDRDVKITEKISGPLSGFGGAIGVCTKFENGIPFCIEYFEDVVSARITKSEGVNLNNRYANFNKSGLRYTAGF